MNAGSRGARCSSITRWAVTGLTILLGLPVAVLSDETPAPEEQARFSARYRAALADLWQGRVLESIDPLYELYLEGGCGNHKCELRLAQAYRYLGDLEEAHRWAESALTRAAQVGVSGAEEYNELGVCLFARAKGDPAYLEQSLAALRQAVDRHTIEGDTYRYNLSQVLLASGRTEEAETILRGFENSAGLRPIIERGEAVIGDFRRLEVVDRQYAKYTQEAKRQGVEGKILLKAIIDADGRVSDTEVIQGLPYGLTEAALKALRKTRFLPATVDGRPVAAVYRQMLDMKLTATLVGQRQISADNHSH